MGCKRGHLWIWNEQSGHCKAILQLLLKLNVHTDLKSISECQNYDGQIKFFSMQPPRWKGIKQYERPKVKTIHPRRHQAMWHRNLLSQSTESVLVESAGDEVNTIWDERNPVSSINIDSRFILIQTGKPLASPATIILILNCNTICINPHCPTLNGQK